MPPTQQTKKYVKNKFQVRIEELTQEMEVSNATIQSQNAELDVLKKSLVELEERVASLTDNENELKSAKKDIEEQLSGKTGDLDALQKAFDELNLEYTQVKADLNNIFVEKSSTINTLTEKNEILASNYAELKEKYQNYNSVLKSENLKYIDLSNQNKELALNVSNLNDVINTLNAEKQELLEELDVIKSKYNTVLKKYEDTVNAGGVASSSNTPLQQERRVFQSKRAVSSRRLV